VAIDGGRGVEMASATDHVRLGEAPKFWINEVRLAAKYKGQGIGRRLMERLLDCGRKLG
jgi:GNAT superfamily N-acetyltransferase